jgi:hypothetical protein
MCYIYILYRYINMLTMMMCVVMRSTGRSVQASCRRVHGCVVSVLNFTCFACFACFTCFTSTKVQILTQRALVGARTGE